MSTTVGEYGLASTFHNSGAREQVKFTSLDQQSGMLAFDVMGGTANIQSVGKAQVYVAPAGAVAVGAPFYVVITLPPSGSVISATVLRSAQCRKCVWLHLHQLQ